VPVILTNDRFESVARIADGQVASVRVAAARGLKPDELVAVLRRELEWIPLKAMRKDRSERYRSASEMADDIQNYLGHRPLIAGPEKTTYRLRKLVRRNKLAFAAFAVMVASLLGATAVSVWFGVREAAGRERESGLLVESEAARERESALRIESEAARDRAQRLNTFMARIFRSQDPGFGGRQDAKVLDAMRTAVREIDAGAFTADPELEAETREIIGAIFLSNGRPGEAETQMKEVLRTRGQIAADAGVERGDALAAALNNLAIAMNGLGRLPEAVPLAEEALAIRRRIYGSTDNAELASLLHTVAIMRASMGRHAEAEALHDETLAMRRRLYPGDHLDIASSLSALGLNKEGVNKPEEAEAAAREALAMFRRLHNGDHPQVALTLNNVATMVEGRGDLAGAETLHNEALEMRRRMFKGDHPQIANSLNNLAFVRSAMEKYEEAAALFKESLEMNRRIFQGDHPQVAASLNNMGTTLLKLGDLDGAERHIEEALEISRRIHKGDHRDVARVTMSLAGVRHRTPERRAEARAGFDEGIAMWRRLSPDCSPSLAAALHRSGEARRDEGDAEGARADFAEALEIGTKVLPPGSKELEKYRAAAK